MIPVFVAIGVVVAGMAVTTSYVVLVAHKNNRNSEDTDFRCPECAASVDGTTEVCPECRAEFRDGEYECPVCGSAVTVDTKICMVCNERFEEEEKFECPHCGEPIPPESIVCERCDEEFWSAIKPATVAEVDALAETQENMEEAGEVPSS
jgi:DNA-directed RNA polymerase subunit RPC12/RpoP